MTLARRTLIQAPPLAPLAGSAWLGARLLTVRPDAQSARAMMAAAGGRLSHSGAIG